jgi:hypothetical protein
MINGTTSNTRNVTILSSILIGTILTLSTFAAHPASAANPSVSPGQWTGSEGVYPNNWDWSNQTQLSASNVNQLQVNWVYPTPPTPSQYLSYNKYTTVPLGITFTGSMINGIVYTMTQYSLIQASNAHTGALIWQAQLPNLKFNCMHNTLQISGANATGHYHNIWYTAGVKGVWANTPLIWVMSANHTAFAYNALTGSLAMHWQTYNPCATFPNGATGVPGNFGLFDSTTQNAVFDAARGIVVTGSSVGEGTDAARGFFMGYNISVNPPKLMWTTFISPPQDGSNPNWAISDVANMTNAWIWNAPQGNATNLKTLPAAALKSMLYDDWGYASKIDFTQGKSWSGVGTSWGGNWALDTTTGSAFVATSEPSDFPNATLRPGPDLWADSMLSINDQTGTINWAFQGIPHDLWDLDCSWTDMLATITVNGQPTLANIKSCKSGDLWALNAATGAVLWHFYPGANDVGYNGLPNSVCNGDTSCTLGYSGAGTKFKPAFVVPKYGHAFDPTNRSEMTRGWPNAPSPGAYISSPNGGSPTENNGAYDPTTNMVFYNTMSRPSNSTAGIISGTKGIWGGGAVGNLPTTALDVASTTNDTVWAFNANTGVPMWAHFIPQLGLRGGVSVTNGMVLVPLDNGSLLFLNEQTGTILRNLFIGSAMVTQPIIGTDVNGKTEIVLPAELPISSGVYVGTGRTTSSPGFLFAVALGPAPTASTATVTATVTGAGATATSTATVTATAPGGTSTVTSTAAGGVSTSTVVSSTGIDPTTFYAVAALAVIFVIATGFLAMRGRKPS